MIGMVRGCHSLVWFGLSELFDPINGLHQSYTRRPSTLPSPLSPLPRRRLLLFLSPTLSFDHRGLLLRHVAQYYYAASIVLHGLFLFISHSV